MSVFPADDVVDAARLTGSRFVKLDAVRGRLGAVGAVPAYVPTSRVGG
jgi:hypothetical protein